jgi:hypothetical protein
LMSLPSIDEVVQDPKRLAGLSEELLTALLARCGAAQGIITAALVTAGLSKRIRPEAEPDPKTKVLNVEEAVEMLHVKRRWLYRNAGRYPFIRRLSRKKLLISEKGLREWLASRP